MSIFLIQDVGKHFKNRWVWGVLLNIFLIFFGLFITAVNSFRDTLPDGNIIAVGTIIENPVENPSYYHVLVKLTSIKKQQNWATTDVKVQCTLQRNAVKQELYLGEQLTMRSSWGEIKNTGNPFEFDYKKYMNQRGFYYRTFVDSCNWYITGRSGFVLTIWTLKIRNKILDYFKKLNLSQSAFAVVSALTFGDSSYLDPDLKAAYINSGTIHILAVSGMHIALIFWLLQQITRPLMAWKNGIILRTMIVLSIIWMYSLFTGLTASVVRASVMFSFWMLGDAANRRVNIYNTISASALLLLIIDPQALFDIGFQLSYMAVLGIVVFYKDIFNWLFIRNKILVYIWSMIAVSLAAQLFTIPLTLYYFHQFPNYFLFSNIVALPLSTVILYGAIVALIIAPLKFLWLPVGWLLTLLIDAMNLVLLWIEHLPFSVSSGITITGIMVVSLFAIVVSIRVFIANKKALPVYIILFCCIIMSLEVLRNRVCTLRSSGMIVYNTPSSYLIQIREGFDSYIISGNRDMKHERLVKPYNEQFHLKNIYEIFLDSIHFDDHQMLYKNFLFYKDKRIFIWDKQPRFKKPVKVDVLILSHVKFAEIAYLRKYVDAKEIIITHDVDRRVSKSIRDFYSSRNVHCVTLKTDGYWAASP
jgi:competence protein ComEC